MAADWDAVLCAAHTSALLQSLPASLPPNGNGRGTGYAGSGAAVAQEPLGSWQRIAQLLVHKLGSRQQVCRNSLRCGQACKGHATAMRMALACLSTPLAPVCLQSSSLDQTCTKPA